MIMMPPPLGGGNLAEEEVARDIKELVEVYARTLPSQVFQSERAQDAMFGACGSLDPRSEYEVRAAAGRRRRAAASA